MINHNDIPEPEILETTIRESLKAKYGKVYVNLILDGWGIDSCDANNLCMHSASAFTGRIIRSRLLFDMRQTVSYIYGICPDVIIEVNET